MLPQPKTLRVVREAFKKNAFKRMDFSTLRVSPKLFLRHYYIVCVLASFVMIISIEQNKRCDRTTLISHSTISNIILWWFWEFDAPSAKTSQSSQRSLQKDAFRLLDFPTLWDSSKFFLHHYCIVCVLASFVMIISIEQNKRCDCTTLRSHSTISNAILWWFLEFDTPKELPLTCLKMRQILWFE